uniref:Uncharacterized protein n=1 Tax=Sporolithon durum TaxID=48970 RepID=A0A141SCV4_9FLOR|nr:hypothetical protein Sdur_065 [Sporolithon durum]AMK96122.1 hypothetical protein Sdur_065 [Sporolithon durum]
MQNQILSNDNLYIKHIYEVIEEQILQLQKKIYVCAKECKTIEMHNLQSILLQNKYIRLFTNHIIIKQLEKYCWIYTNYKKNLKSLVLYSLFNNDQRFEELSLIQEKIVKYKIFLALQSEWKTKFEYCLKIKKNSFILN